MGKIKNTIILIAVIIFFASLVCNVIQYKLCCKEPVTETVTERDTVVELDTIYMPETGKYEIINPEPVMIDSFIAIYRDTFYHDYGWIKTSERVKGDLLSKGLDFKFDIPTYYKTRTITNTITRTVRNNLFYVTGGLNYSFADQGFYPSVGAAYIWNNQKRIISLEYSLEKRIDLTVGFSFWR